jgi:predicted Rossmann-fold nucleotide-binding protein
VDIIEALARRIHDFSIDSALSELLSGHPRVAGIMGGHSMRRTDAFYRKVARLGQLLGKADYFVVTGGGPGVMEAGNLGAYMGAYSADDLEEALDILAGAPAPGTGEYQLRARQVVQRFPRGRENLAIPTWFYPYEPTNLFASHIAKYFSNSIREDGLMAICIHGVVYCPGSAGTIQEIFMDASQNHYGTFNFYSPMVFFGSEGYERQKNLYSMLREVAEGKYYQKLIFMSDDPVEIVEIIRSHPPVPVDGAQ